MPAKETHPPISNRRAFRNRNKATFHILGGRGAYHWQLKMRNGACIAWSNGTYESIQKVMRSITMVMQNAEKSAVESPIKERKNYL